MIIDENYEKNGKCWKILKLGILRKFRYIIKIRIIQSFKNITI
jgi:hypothetical protein